VDRSPEDGDGKGTDPKNANTPESLEERVLYVVEAAFAFAFLAAWLFGGVALFVGREGLTWHVAWPIALVAGLLCVGAGVVRKEAPGRPHPDRGTRKTSDEGSPGGVGH